MTPHPESLKIVRYPDPVLRQVAEPIDAIDDTIKAVAARMIVLMYEAEGVGLAAPQVGLSWRLFVVRGLEQGEPDRVFINPRLETHGDDVACEEGCLSLPKIHVDVVRPEAATITALDLDGQEFTLESDEHPARIWQHEYAHLDGKLIIDRLTPMQRLATRKAIKELKAAAARAH